MEHSLHLLAFESKIASCDISLFQVQQMRLQLCGTVQSEAPHEVAQREADAQVPHVRERLQDTGLSAKPHQHAHRYQATSLQCL